MKNLVDFFVKSESNDNCFETLSAIELLSIRGGSEPVKPITRPREDYDDEN